jgi:WD40 repeat protein
VLVHSQEWNAITSCEAPDGNLLATASHDREVRLWSVADWRQTQRWNGPGPFDSVAFAPHGGILAAGGGDGLIRLWKLDSGAAIPSLSGHSNHVMDLASAPHGNTLASASWDRTLKLWDVGSGRTLRSLAHEDRVQAVAFARDGRTLASSSDDVVLFWDTLGPVQREQEALAQLTQLLSERPDDIDACASRACIYLAQEQWAEALRDTNRAAAQ